LLHLKARQGGRFSTYLLVYFIYPVLMVTFDHHYYVAAMYLIAIALGLLYFLFGSVTLCLFPANRQGASLLTNRS
jgi:hypothetical protein